LKVLGGILAEVLLGGGQQFVHLGPGLFDLLLLYAEAPLLFVDLLAKPVGLLGHVGVDVLRLDLLGQAAGIGDASGCEAFGSLLQLPGQLPPPMDPVLDLYHLGVEIRKRSRQPGTARQLLFNNIPLPRLGGGSQRSQPFAGDPFALRRQRPAFFAKSRQLARETFDSRLDRRQKRLALSRVEGLAGPEGRELILQERDLVQKVGGRRLLGGPHRCFDPIQFLLGRKAAIDGRRRLLGLAEHDRWQPGDRRQLGKRLGCVLPGVAPHADSDLTQPDD